MGDAVEAAPEAGSAKKHTNYKLTFHSSNNTLFMHLIVISLIRMRRNSNELCVNVLISCMNNTLKCRVFSSLLQ